MAELITESIVTIPRETIRLIDSAQKTIAACEFLTSTQKEFLRLLLLQSSEQEKHQAIKISQIARYQNKAVGEISTSTIRRKLNRLADQGFFTKTPHVARKGCRPTNQYLLVEIDGFLNVKDNAGPSYRNLKLWNKAQNLSLLKKLEFENVQLLKHHEGDKLVSDSLFTGLFDRVMRFSRRDDSLEKRIIETVKIKGTTIKLQAALCSSESGALAVLDDQRIIRVIVSRVLEAIENWTPPENERFDTPSETVEGFRRRLDERIKQLMSNGDLYDGNGKLNLSPQELDLWSKSRFKSSQNTFFLDVVDLAKWLGYASPSSTSVRIALNKALMRLHRTGFRIDIGGDRDSISDALSVMELLGLDGLSCHFRFFTSLYSQHDPEFEFVDKKQDMSEFGDAQDLLTDFIHHETRIWQFSLSNDLYERLKSRGFRHIFQVHPEIMSEDSGFAHTLYNYFTAILSARSGKGGGYNQSLAVLKKTIWPSRSFENFDREIINLIRKYVEMKTPGEFDSSLESNIASMFGFTFTLYKDRRGNLCLNVI